MYIFVQISLTFGWSRTGTATRTAILIGLSRVMSIILLFSYGKCGIDDGEPRKEAQEREKIKLNYLMIFGACFNI